MATAASDVVLRVAVSARVDVRVSSAHYTRSDPAPTFASLNYTLGDTDGGGQPVVVSGTGLSGATCTLGGNSCTVTGTTATSITFTLPTSGSTGVKDLVITGSGGNVTATGAFEYWTPLQVSSLLVYLDANKGWTAGGTASWASQGGTYTFSQSTGANQPTQTASVFGTMPSIRCVPQQWMLANTPVNFASGASIFYVGKWTSSDSVAADAHNPPLAMCGGELGAYCEFGANAGTIEVQVFNGGGTAFFDGTTTTLNDGHPHLCGFTHNSGTSDLKIYLGATQEGATHNSAYQAANYIDSAGNGYLDGDGWDGDLGAVVAVSGEIAGGDLTKLNAWSQQRWGTP